MGCERALQAQSGVRNEGQTTLHRLVLETTNCVLMEMIEGRRADEPWQSKPGMRELGQQIWRASDTEHVVQRVVARFGGVHRQGPVEPEGSMGAQERADVKMVQPTGLD